MVTPEVGIDNCSSLLFLGENTLELLGITDLSSIQILNQWHPGGSETYVTDFLLGNGPEETVHLIAKACIKLGARHAMNEWFNRRERLLENGVLFPHIYTTDKNSAVWVEEFVPLAFKEAFHLGNEVQKENLKKAFFETYLKIEGAGFLPKSVYDFRSHGEDVVVIDVGEDLGSWKEIDQCDMGSYARAERFFRAGI